MAIEALIVFFNEVLILLEAFDSNEKKGLASLKLDNVREVLPTKTVRNLRWGYENNT